MLLSHQTFRQTLGGNFLAEQYKQTHHHHVVLKVEAIFKHMLC